jgi:circadian clock protein KaiC
MTDAITARASTGIDGLDEVLHGGFIPGRSYLVRGDPGTGKTILGGHYLEAGVANDETVLYVGLEEAVEDIRTNASSLGFRLEGVDFLDLSPESDAFVAGQSYDVFSADEVDRDRVTRRLVDRVETLEPDRVFVDPITQLRYLAPDEYQFREQVVGLGRFLGEHGGTVLFTSQSRAGATDDDLQFLSDGTIELGHDDTGRTLRVPKFRGSATQGGTHAMRIDGAGIRVFPRLVPGDYGQSFVAEAIPSGIPELDDLLHGGIERGTVTVISGTTGVGKTTTGTQFMKEAAERGERSVMYLFEESRATMLARSKGIGVPVSAMLERGTLQVEEVEALDVSAQEFAQTVREEVERRDARIVMIDGIDGYRQSVRGPEEALTQRLHALCRYLKNMGVTVVLADELNTITGELTATSAGISYLADNILFIRHIELRGELRKAIGVLKKRTSDFERTVRELEITSEGLKVGDPLRDVQGVMSGTPELLDRNFEGD